MAPSPLPPSHHLPAKRLLLMLAGCFASVGATVKLAGGSHVGWPAVMLGAQCIGFSIVAIDAALRELAGRRRRPAWLVRMAILAVAFPLGFQIGGFVTASLLGHPLRFAGLTGVSRPALVISAAATVAVMYLLWSQSRLAQAALEKSEMARLAAEAQLRLLQAQIEPHMLFNTLANLQSLIETDAPRACHMVDQLIVFMRRALQASRAEVSTLADEFALVAAYLELMTIRMGSRLRYDLNLPTTLADITVPSMLLQPLVENAIKHGLEPSVAGGHLSVAATRDGKLLVLTVMNDSEVAPPAEPESGFGLQQIRERLAMRYGDDASLVLDASSSSATAIVRMPT